MDGATIFDAGEQQIFWRGRNPIGNQCTTNSTNLTISPNDSHLSQFCQKTSPKRFLGTVNDEEIEAMEDFSLLKVLAADSPHV